MNINILKLSSSDLSLPNLSSLPLVYSMIIRDFPFPPSDNRKFLSRTFIKSKEWRKYETAVEVWAIINHRTLTEARFALQQMKRLTIEIDLYFERSRVLAKAGSDKKIDTANFLKSLLDRISYLLHFDDSQLFTVSVHKRIHPKPEENSVDFFITPWQESPRG